jgi:hypothetical protein
MDGDGARIDSWLPLNRSLSQKPTLMARSPRIMNGKLVCYYNYSRMAYGDWKPYKILLLQSGFDFI